MQEPLLTRVQRLRHVALLARYGTGLLFLVTFFGTHYPINIPPGLMASSDKIVHFVVYMMLTISFLVSWELSAGILRPAHYFLVWLFGTIYGAFDEITQIPVGRQCDGMDWLADIVGIVVGLTLFRLTRSLLYRWC